MATIAVIIVVLAMTALAYFKLPMLQVLATIVVALVSTFVAFGYHEFVGGQLAAFVPSLAAWAQAISFTLLFVLVFAVLQTGVVALVGGSVDLGQLPERIGRPICGLILGWIIAGVLVTAAWLAPLGAELPYARFDSRRPDVMAPKHVLLNADGMVTGWFDLVSRGSFRALRQPASFGVVRAGFLDQIALNRLQDKVDRATEKQAINAPSKNGIREVPANLTDTNGDVVNAPNGSRLQVVRLGIRKQALKDASPFTLAQVSVVCQGSTDASSALSGQGVAVYPLGYLNPDKRLDRNTSLVTPMPSIDGSKVRESQQWIDFVFAIPNDKTVTLARFKRNNIVTLSTVSDEDEPIEPSGYGPTKASQNDEDSEAQAPSEEG